VIKQLVGDRSGRVFAVDYTDVSILGYVLCMTWSAWTGGQPGGGGGVGGEREAFF
jgi:hypothetical protein